MINSDNAVTELAEADRAASAATNGRSGRRRRRSRSPAHASNALGVDFDPEDPAAVLGKLGPIAKMVGATLTNTANPTMLSAGYKVNVVPQIATAQVDGRFLPGHEDEFFREWTP